MLYFMIHVVYESSIICRKMYITRMNHQRIHPTPIYIDLISSWPWLFNFLTLKFFVFSKRMRPFMKFINNFTHSYPSHRLGWSSQDKNPVLRCLLMYDVISPEKARQKLMLDSNIHLTWTNTNWYMNSNIYLLNENNGSHALSVNSRY